MRPLRIGLSLCFIPPEPGRVLFNGRRLQFVEDSMIKYLQKRRVLAYPVPDWRESSCGLAAVVSDLDGLVLHGGTDVAPGSYGEEPISGEWPGDSYRDDYDRGLIEEAMRQKRPIFGICRGYQILNVALGGSLYQDITTQKPGSLVHRDAELYEQNFHKLDICPGGVLEQIYGVLKDAKINSVHHQGIKKLAEGLQVEALSTQDGIVEAFSRPQRQKEDNFVLGVQWHPEFQEPGHQVALDSGALYDYFLKQVEGQRQMREEASCS